jgi:hypothetical protein
MEWFDDKNITLAKLALEKICKDNQCIACFFMSGGACSLQPVVTILKESGF